MEFLSAAFKTSSYSSVENDPPPSQEAENAVIGTLNELVKDHQASVVIFLVSLNAMVIFSSPPMSVVAGTLVANVILGTALWNHSEIPRIVSVALATFLGYRLINSAFRQDEKRSPREEKQPNYFAAAIPGFLSSNSSNQIVAAASITTLAAIGAASYYYVSTATDPGKAPITEQEKKDRTYTNLDYGLDFLIVAKDAEIFKGWQKSSQKIFVIRNRKLLQVGYFLIGNEDLGYVQANLSSFYRHSNWTVSEIDTEERTITLNRAGQEMQMKNIYNDDFQDGKDAVYKGDAVTILEDRTELSTHTLIHFDPQERGSSFHCFSGKITGKQKI